MTTHLNVQTRLAEADRNNPKSLWEFNLSRLDRIDRLVSHALEAGVTYTELIARIEQIRADQKLKRMR